MEPKNFVNLSFNEWIDFIFNHPVPEDRFEDSWYLEFSFDFWYSLKDHEFKLNQISYATRLFRDSNILVELFSPDQINQGFSALLSGLDYFCVNDLIRDEDIPIENRRECIISMVDVFRTGVFTTYNQMESCYMWWDYLRWFPFDDTESEVPNIMFEALAQILEFPTPYAQLSALHGLGHLEHPSKVTVIEEYLNSNPALDDDFIKYARAAQEGKVL
jgi:hypothetical protein